MTIHARSIAAGRRFPHLDPAGIGRDGENLAWQRDAACRDADPDLFFPELGPGMHAQIAEARRICAACPVRVACLHYAQARREPFGIWGGETEGRRPARGAARATRTRRDRDREIAHLSKAGLTAEQVAHRLDICRDTVYRARARLQGREVVA